MHKVPAKYGHIVFAFFMTMLMAFIMSGILTLINLGLVDDFVAIWLRGYLIAWSIAFPTVLLVLPVVRRLVAKVVEGAG